MNEQLKNALEKVIKIKKNVGNNAYAIAYVQTVLWISNPSEKTMKCQVRYILSNLQYWRGEEARETKKVLNDFINGRLA
jgi:hypothetical protein